MSAGDLTERLFPETAAGGYCRVDGTVEFFNRVSALIQPHMTVLDFGAGRGRGIQDDPVPFRRSLQMLKGKCARLIGVDVDAAVMDNPGLDEAHHIAPNARIPVADASVDLVVSDHVLEHVDDPEAMAQELFRVLKPGGWLCARTPHRWGYIGIGTNLIPNSLHTRFLGRLQPGRKEEDVFPTRYRINTHGALRRHFPADRWRHCSYVWDSSPGYVGNSMLLARLVQLWCWIMPPGVGAKLHVFIQKRDA